MRPGIRLMLGQRLTVKLMGMTVMLMLPLLLFTALAARTSMADLDYIAEEQAGVRVASDLAEVAALVQTHRGLSNRKLAGDNSVETPLSDTREALRAALGKTDLTVAGLPFALGDEWSEQRRAISELMVDPATPDRAAVFAQHTAQVDGVQRLLALVGERSGLLFDPVPASFFLMDVTIERLLPWAEALGVARGAGAGLLTQGDPLGTDVGAMRMRAAAIHAQLQDLGMRMDALERAGVEPLPAWAARTAVAA